MSETLKFKIFYFVRYFGDAFFYPFMSVYFISKGISDEKLGIILAITPITTVLVNPFWNYLAKNMKMSRTILKIMTLIEGLCIIFLTQVSGFELYALIVALIAFFCSPFIYIQDGYTATYANSQKIEYSSIRIYASIAYVIASAIAGFLIAWVGYVPLFIAGGSFFIITSLLVFWIRPIEHGMKAEEKKHRDIKALLHNKEFYKYLVFYTIVVGAVRIGDSFFGVYLTSGRSMSLTAYGLLYASFVSVEALTLRFLMQRGNSFHEKNLMLFASVLLVLRFSTYAMDLPVGVVVAITMFRGLSWGTMIYTHIKYVIKIVKVENVTTAILIITLAFSIFAGIGSFLSGTLIQNSGYSWFYLAITGLLVLGTLFLVFFTPHISQEDRDEEEDVVSV